MPPTRDPVPRARSAWSWLGGILVLGVAGAGVAAAAVVLWENVDIRQITPRAGVSTPVAPVEPEPALPAVRSTPPGSGGFEVVLFDSPRNAAFFPDPDHYAGELAAWRAVAEQLGGEVRTVSDAAGLLEVDDSEVLLLPEAPCLSAEERSAVDAHLRAEGGVVATWAFGARDGACAWSGWRSVADLTGALDVREIPAREGLFLTVPGGLALSPGLDPGTRIELLPDAALALRIPGPRVYWSDWALNPRPDESGGGAEVAAVATWSPLGGRVGWMGFRLGQTVTPADSLRAVRLARNALTWVAGRPTAALAPWPDARQSAAMFLLDVEAQPENAVATAELLRSREVPGTFFVVSGLVEDLDGLAETLTSAGEIGSHTVDHAPLANLTAQDQRARLRRSAAELRRWAGVEPLGLHPPEETFDSTTLAAWRNVGGTYLVASNENRSASPELHRTDDGVMVLLPRVTKDDYNVIVQDRVLRAEGLRDALLAGARKLHAIGGLGIVAGHTQILRPGARIGALEEVVDEVTADDDRWISTGRRVAAWWRSRAETRLSFDPPPDDAGSAVPPAPSLGPGARPATDLVPDLFVTAPPDTTVSGLWVDVVLGDLPADLAPLVNGEPVEFVITQWGVRVPVGELAPGETRRIAFVRVSDHDGGSTAAPASGTGR